MTLLDVPGVELVRAGLFDLSTGRHEFTTAQLVGAVEAMKCPAVRRPVIKLGHTDPRFDGEPAVGFIDNMTVDAAGTVVHGDYRGLPAWLGNGVLASAWPDRSIEGLVDYQCTLGHTHPLVIESVALLGVTAPGVSTLSSLQDVAALYGVAASAGSPHYLGNQKPVSIGRKIAATFRPKEGPMTQSRHTPLVRKIAAANGVDLAAVKGTGIGGRVTQADVHAAAQANAQAIAAASADAAWFGQSGAQDLGPSPTPASPATQPYSGVGVPAFTASGIDPSVIAGLPGPIRPVVAALESRADAYAIAADYRGLTDAQASAAVVRDMRVPADLAFAHRPADYVEPPIFDAMTDTYSNQG